VNDGWNQKLDDAAWAWAPYEPGAGHDWDLRLAGHLYRRTAFGGTWDELQAALKDGPQSTVEKLVRPKGETNAFNTAYDEYEREAAKSSSANNAVAWWLRRMIETPHPLLEQMTLFWHNYFGLTNERLSHPAMLCRHLHRLRHQALGKFDALLEGVLNEPALFVSLEARANRKARPNSEFARILLEQFLLGPGHFSESDVQATAQAFTGWFVSQDELRYAAREHDTGLRQLLGREGDFEVKDVLHMVLQQPAASQLVVRRLYRWLISETSAAPEALITPLAADFAKDYDLARLVETVLRSNLFFSPAAYRQKIKSPIEFSVGLVRSFGASVGTLPLSLDLAALGQNLYEPPTVKGWAGHRSWLNRLTILGRASLAHSLVSNQGGYGGKMDIQGIAQKHGAETPQATSDFLCDLLLQGDLPRPARQSLAATAAGAKAMAEAISPSTGVGQVAALLAAMPEYQLA
jgi:uncharacterized protein (DUF1800 family)